MTKIPRTIFFHYYRKSVNHALFYSPMCLRPSLLNGWDILYEYQPPKNILDLNIFGTFHCLLRSILAHFGPFRSISVHFGQFRSISVNFGQFRSILVRFGPFRSSSYKISYKREKCIIMWQNFEKFRLFHRMVHTWIKSARKPMDISNKVISGVFLKLNEFYTLFYKQCFWSTLRYCLHILKTSLDCCFPSWWILEKLEKLKFYQDY